MATPTNYVDFPLAATLALFSALMATSGVPCTFVDDDGPIPMSAGLLGYVSQTGSAQVGWDQRVTASSGDSTAQTTINTSQVTLQIRVESFLSTSQASAVLERLRTQLQTDAAGVDLRSRNTSFAGCGPIRYVRAVADNRRIFVAAMDLSLLWTSVVQTIDTGAIDTGTITGTVTEGTGRTPDTRTVTASLD